MAGTEPSDGLRVSNASRKVCFPDNVTVRGFQKVVNALLTQLDKLKHKKNVLVMSTSNLAKAIGLFLLLVLVPYCVNAHRTSLNRFSLRGPRRYNSIR